VSDGRAFVTGENELRIVPEPGTALLVGAGLLLVAGRARPTRNVGNEDRPRPPGPRAIR